MKKMVFLVLVIPFLFPSVVSAIDTSRYFPLEPGNSWTYQTATGHIFTQLVQPALYPINGYPTRLLLSSDGYQSFLSNDLQGIQEHAEYYPGYPGIFAVLSPPSRYATLYMELGDQVSSSGILTYFVDGYGESYFNYSGTSFLEAAEVITVPAGTFNTLRLQITLSIWGDYLGTPYSATSHQTLWLAEDMGVVRQEIDGATYILINSNLIDRTPDPFQFLPVVDAPLNTYMGSNEITVTGISSSTEIRIAGGEYNVNDGPYTSASSTVSRGENVRVRVLSGSAYNVTTSATLTIGGVSATFNVTTITPRITFSQPFLRFLFQEVGTTSPGQLILLSNSGLDPLIISGFTTSGDFSSINNCGASVGIGESCSLFVYFNPTGPGTRKGTVTISSNAAENPHTVRLLGIGGVNFIPQNFGIFREGAWFIDNNVNANWEGCVTDICFPSFGGFSEDRPIIGDWTGDGTTKVGIYRSGMWYLDQDGDGAWDGCTVDGCLGPLGGFSQDLPVVGDWSGDGKTKVGIYRSGMWYLDKNGNGQWDGCGTDLCLGPFGGYEIDLPVAGDWVGDGVTRIGIYRQGMWYLDWNGNGKWDGCGIDGCFGPFGGFSQDIPVVGDWDGTAIVRIGIYREGRWYLDYNGSGLWEGCKVDYCGGPFGGFFQDIPVVR